MKALVQNIGELSQHVGHDVKIMEVCGTHTMAAFRSGLRQLLPDSVRLVSGPGCPVCVTDPSYLDAAIELCGRPNVIIATFGDLVRVPGTDTSLERERAAGAKFLARDRKRGGGEFRFSGPRLERFRDAISGTTPP